MSRCTITDQTYINYLCDELSKCSLEHIIWFLPNLVSYILRTDCIQILTELISMSNYDESFASYLYYELMIYSQSTQYSSIEFCISTFLSQSKFSDSIIKSRKLFEKIPHYCSQSSKNQTSQFIEPISIPFTEELKCIQVCLDSMNQMNSYHKPCKFNLQCLNSENQIEFFPLLWKREDIRKDLIILNIIQLMNHILQEHISDLQLVQYSVLPLDSTQGFTFLFIPQFYLITGIFLFPIG